MTKDIENLRSMKFPDPLANPNCALLGTLVPAFMAIAVSVFCATRLFASHSDRVDAVFTIALLMVSVGCIVMALGYLFLRSRLRRINRYQEEMVQAIYDCLKEVEQQAERHDEQYNDLKSRLNTLIYMTFRHSMCPDVEQFRSFMNAIEGNLDLTDLSDEIKEKILYDGFTTPCAIVRSEEWLLDYLDAEEFWTLYRKMYSRHPLIAELDVIPQLFRHVIDSADGYNLYFYERK